MISTAATSQQQRGGGSDNAFGIFCNIFAARRLSNRDIGCILDQLCTPFESGTARGRIAWSTPDLTRRQQASDLTRRQQAPRTRHARDNESAPRTRHARDTHASSKALPRTQAPAHRTGSAGSAGSSSAHLSSAHRVDHVCHQARASSYGFPKVTFGNSCCHQ